MDVVDFMLCYCARLCDILVKGQLKCLLLLLLLLLDIKCIV